MKNLTSFFQAFKDTVRDITTQAKQVQLLMIASSLAYTTILSIIPILAVSFAIFQVFGGMQKIYSIVEPLILSNLAQGVSEDVIATLHRFIDNTHAGVVGLGGLIGLIFTSISLLFSAEKAINQVWQARITRSLFHRIASYWLFITLGPLALSVAAQVKVKWQFSLFSATFAAIFWNLARLGYTLYTKHVLNYSKIYGSLGAVPILLLWIYILWVIILSGAALTAALQKRIS
jgi:membrane protein